MQSYSHNKSYEYPPYKSLIQGDFFMRDDQIESMKKLAEEVADDFIVTTCAAINTSIATKQERGDKGFLYKISKDTAGVLATIERVLAFKYGSIDPISKTKETQEAYEKKLAQEAEAKAQKLRERIRAS